MTWREPTEIRLPDGRIFQISDLRGRRTRAVNYNLRTRQRNQQTPDLKKIPRQFVETAARKPVKYTLEDRVWQSQATAEQLQERYGITTEQAKQMRYQARYILEKLDLL